MGAYTYRFYGRNISTITLNYFSNMNNPAPTNYFMVPWGRYPSIILGSLGILDSVLPKKSLNCPLGDFSVIRGWPTVNDFVSKVVASPPPMDMQDEKWISYQELGICYSPARNTQVLLLMTTGGNTVFRMCQLTTGPYFGRKFLTTNQNFGAPAGILDNTAYDVPVFSAIPSDSTWTQEDMFLAFGTGYFGTVDRRETMNFLLPLYDTVGLGSDIYLRAGSRSSNFAAKIRRVASAFRLQDGTLE